MQKYNRYSRISWVEERQLKRKSIILILASVVIVVAFVLYGITGIPELIGYIRNSGNSSQPATDNIAPPPPFLFALSDATNSADLVIRGTSEPGSSVEILVDSQQIPLITADDKGQFRSFKVSLREGQNTIQALAIDKAGNHSSPSQPVVVTLETKAPQITISGPHDGDTISGSKNQSLTVYGSVDKDATLSLNSRAVPLSVSNTFSALFYLSAGSNQITLVAVDSAGNTSSKSITVNYQP